MLILCEKPSVAKDFAKALGASGKKGFYEGIDLVITYCVGHLFSPLEPEGYDLKYKKWALLDLPIIPPEFRYTVNASTAEQAKIVLELLAAHAENELLIATDAGREGELIARIALKEAGITDISRAKRFWVSEALTKEVILKGIKEAKPLSEYNSISDQAFARQKADWLLGMNFSRLMSIGNPPPPFSVGRVQTAVLSSVASRNDEVKNFVASPFKELEARITSKDGVTVKALLENPKTSSTEFFAEDEAYLKTAFENSSNKPLDSVDVTSAQKTLRPPKLLNITGLQKEAFKRFWYKPEETLSIAQSLYETHKCLSYPRTPSRVMGDNNVELFKEKFELLKDDSAISKFSDPSLISENNKHIFDSSKLEDHHALIPLNKIPDSANEKERNIYSIVLESFFTVCMPDYIYNEKSLRFHISLYTFIAKIRETVRKGWKEAAATNQKGDDDSEETEVPFFDDKDCTHQGLTILEKKTRPKKEFALDTLLAFMEHPRGEEEGKLVGLGTPATRAEIIKTLFVREYVHEEKKKLFVSERGHFLLEQLSKHDGLKKLTSASHTTEWENRLLENPREFEKEIALYVSECVKAGSVKTVFQEKAVGTCPLCGKPVVETKLGYGCSGYKDNPKCAFVIWKTIAGAAVSKEDAALLLNGQKTKIKKCINKEGKPFEAAFVLEGGKTVFNFKQK